MTFVAGGALKPIGGHILSHASATRMFLRKGMWSVKVLRLSLFRRAPTFSGRILTSQFRCAKDAPKNALRNSWIAPTDRKAKRRTSWTKVAGPTCKPQDLQTFRLSPNALCFLPATPLSRWFRSWTSYSGRFDASAVQPSSLRLCLLCIICD